MTPTTPNPGSIVRGSLFPEPVQVIICTPLGASLKLVGKGLDSGRVYEPILDAQQLAGLQISPEKQPFDGNPLHFRLGVEALRLALAYEYDPYFSLSIARVDPLPHQLEAVYDYFIKQPRIRFLLADDPGAGKTIMAGLLLKELKIRGLAKRTLIVTPANLTFQWQRELKDKFRENFEIVRGDVLRANYGTNPWQEKNQVITSVSWVSRIDDARESLLRSNWDLIIVDEAHKMSAADPEHKTLAYALGENLSTMTDHFLLMTATPHKGDPEHFCLFLRLLDADVYADVKSLEEAMQRNSAPFYLRRTKEALVTFPHPDTGKVSKLFTKRVVQTVSFQIDSDEWDFYDALTRYVEDQSIRAQAANATTGRAVGFTMALLQRRLATEAAGEGINLQFCWLMINYDIPWNPIRLEQRMGRIHRYGQEKDCLIFNFVASNTREGRVMEKLFERIKQIEEDLDPGRTGKVFNVLGDIFPANQLEKMIRDMYLHNLTEESIKSRIIEEVDTTRFRQITDSTLEGLAKKELNLSAIVGKSAEARERRLVPEVIEDFFTHAGPVVGLLPKAATDGIGNVETAMEALAESCYYMRVDRNRYRFGLSPNLNKLLADRRANVDGAEIEQSIRAEILKVFEKQPGVEVLPFPEKSNQIADRPVLTLAVLQPEDSMAEKQTLQMIDGMIREHGSSGRTFKSALMFSVADDDAALRDEARKLLAWQAIKDEEEDTLDDTQQTQLAENLKKAQRDLRECVWRTYKNVALLDKDGKLRVVDLGLVHSSQANSMVKLIVDRLRQDGDIETGVSPNFLVRNWPPAFTEWSTKSVRDAFFASPQFPRLLDGDSVKETIARGVSGGILGYVGKSGTGYKPFVFGSALGAAEIEISDDMFIITAEEAKTHIEPPILTTLTIWPDRPRILPGSDVAFQARGADQHGRPMTVPAVTWTMQGGKNDGKGGFTAGPGEGEFLVEAAAGALRARTVVIISRQQRVQSPLTTPPVTEVIGLRWSGEVPAQKWMNFYTKVLAKYATTGGLKVRVTFEVAPDGGLLPHRIDETKALLRELGLDDSVDEIA